MKLRFQKLEKCTYEYIFLINEIHTCHLFVIELLITSETVHKIELNAEEKKMLSQKMETFKTVKHCLIRGTAIADNVMREQTPHFFTSKQKWVTDQRSKAQIHNIY